MALKLPGRWFRRQAPLLADEISDAALTRGCAVRLILHAKVALSDSLRQAVARLRAQGHEIEVRVTWEPGDAERFATEAAADMRVGSVVAGGGDGSINAVVTGLMDSTIDVLPSLGILPLGTANDFARACGIPGAVSEALELVTETNAHPVDVGRVNGRYFLNVATGGFGTDVTLNTPGELKKVLGGAAYLLTGIGQASSISARHAVIEGPEFSWSGGFLAMAVGNGRYAGGGVPVTEHAYIDNGLFDLSILPEVTVEHIPDVLRTLLDLGFSAEALDSHMIRARAHAFSVRSETPLQINLDGEPLQSTHFEFEVLDQAIGLHLPPDTDILQKN